MTLALLYWILMLLWLVVGMWGTWTPANFRPAGSNLLLFVLLVLLGWKAFGPPIHQ